MNFDDFDKKMRVYEESIDQCIPPEVYMIARLDGRGFTRLTKQICQFEAPFDTRFRDLMLLTVEHLMHSGFRVIYGYTQSDEISLLFHPDADTFSRKVRKLNSLLAAETSAVFSMALGRVAVFDCRIVPLPNWQLVEDYFLWRQEDAHRNSLNSHAYWALRKDGLSPADARKQIKGASNADKNELLLKHGINYNDLPLWQKRGVGLYFEEKEVEGYNPRTGETTRTTRKRLITNMDLPLGDEYRQLLTNILDKCK